MRDAERNRERKRERERERTEERKTIRRQICASANMLSSASQSHCDSYGRVGSWLGGRWKH